jgi:hypothetical protein
VRRWLSHGSRANLRQSPLVCLPSQVCGSERGVTFPRNVRHLGLRYCRACLSRCDGISKMRCLRINVLVRFSCGVFVADASLGDMPQFSILGIFLPFYSMLPPVHRVSAQFPAKSSKVAGTRHHCRLKSGTTPTHSVERVSSSAGNTSSVK